MLYADIIVPLPLQGCFTYSVPSAMEQSVEVGKRVLVPFGRSKTYVGVVMRLHDRKPEGYEVKALVSVLDPTPVVTPLQLQLWQWMADYYMSPLGEVYKAAMPSGLKLEEGYKPKTETYIRLTPAFCSEQALHVALDMLRRADKQMQAFTAYLDMAPTPGPAQDGGGAGSAAASHAEADTILDRVAGLTSAGERQGSEGLGVSLQELLNVSGTTMPIVSQLVKRGLMETYEVEVGRLNREGDYRPELIKQLSDHQQTAYNKLLVSFMKHPVTLLHGVTSSGKTEIYMHLIRRELEQGRQVLYLLPEIALTVQMMERLHRVFGSRLGIYHSKYSDAERVEIWLKQLSDHPYDIILGARSAVFLPFQRLGLVIVDEEHETSFKQQDPTPRYHARSTAIVLAQLFSRRKDTDGQCDTRVLLGTATPSMESYYNARTGKYGLVELMQRYQDIELPEIRVIDTADLSRRKMMTGPFSPYLISRVREALDSGQQAILFQNRRGWSPMVECRQCGWVPHCQNCDVTLTLHKTTNTLTCHYCGMTYQMPAVCPACEGKDLRGRGYGTEKIEDQVRDIFPDARIGRMDLDTTRSRHAYERLIGDFAEGRTNLLVGTQMVSKGLDFDRVAVVGILSADSLMNMPDFRAYEHAFTMMAQVAGRAGRKGRRGLVVLQTHHPDESVIDYVVRNDYRALYTELVAERQEFHYPPFYRLVYVYLKHAKDSLADTAAYEMGTRLRQLFPGRVLGPDKPVVARVKSLCIRKLVLKLESGIDLKRVKQYLLQTQQLMMQDKRYAALQIYFDVDPL